MILMGVVNLTPDSFRAETRAMTPAAIAMIVASCVNRRISGKRASATTDAKPTFSIKFSTKCRIVIR